MTQPQPMQLRRGGAKRGDHGSYVAPPPPDQADADVDTTPTAPTAPTALTESIGADNAPSAAVEPRGRRTVTPAGDATARAKAAYDARPKITFRGVDEDVAGKLKAIYKDQLHRPGGVEGWSEWGRSLLAEIVTQYEQRHGDMSGGEDVQLRAGRVVKN